MYPVTSALDPNAYPVRVRYQLADHLPFGAHSAKCVFLPDSSVLPSHASNMLGHCWQYMLLIKSSIVRIDYHRHRDTTTHVQVIKLRNASSIVPTRAGAYCINRCACTHVSGVKDSTRKVDAQVIANQ